MCVYIYIPTYAHVYIPVCTQKYMYHISVYVGCVNLYTRLVTHTNKCDLARLYSRHNTQVYIWAFDAMPRVPVSVRAWLGPGKPQNLEPRGCNIPHPDPKNPGVKMLQVPQGSEFHGIEHPGFLCRHCYCGLRQVLLK